MAVQLPAVSNDYHCLQLRTVERRDEMVVGYRSRGIGFQLLVRCADMRSTVDTSIEVQICELVSRKAYESQNVPALDHLKLYSFDRRRDLPRERFQFHCTTIAYQRPKPGKQYINLPETLVIGRFEGEGPNLPERVLTRSDLLRVYGQQSVDGILGHIMLRARVGWSLDLESGRPVKKLSNDIQANALAPFALVENSLAKLVSQGTPTVQDSLNKSDVLPSSEAMMEYHGRPGSLLSLPTELMNRIISCVLDDTLPTRATMWNRSEDGPKEQSEFPPLLLTCRLLCSLGLDWFYHQKLVLRLNPGPFKVACKPLLQNTREISFDLSVMDEFPWPYKALIRRMTEIWMEKNQLVRVTIFARGEIEAGVFYPDMLPRTIKTQWILGLFQPMVSFFQTHHINYDVNLEFAAGQAAQAFRELTALNWAICYGYEALAEIALSDSNPPLNIPDCHGNTPLTNAVLRKSHHMIQALLDTGNVDVENPGAQGLTPLGFAAMGGDAQAAALLVNEGKADPNTIMTPDVPTALWLAAHANHREVVNLLLEHEAIDVDARDYRGQTALHIAISKNGPESVDIITALARVADLSLEDNNGETPLTLARKAGYTDVVDVLQDHMRLGSRK